MPPRPRAQPQRAPSPRLSRIPSGTVSRKRRWLDYDECARIAGCTPRSIEWACSSGVLPYRIVTWRRRNWQRRKRLIADVDLLNWIYLWPHRLPLHKAWREPDAGTSSDPRGV